MNTENFSKISAAKQRAVINAAFLCFGRDGYRKTAVSEIAAAANVSKAALFHYFGTKKELYLYLCRLVYDELLREIGVGTDDFFESMRLATEAKIRFIAKHPGMLDFMTSMVNEQSAEVVSEVTAIREVVAEQGTGAYLTNVDRSRFRPDSDPATAWNLVMWVADGYVKANIDTVPVEELASESNRYMEIIKRAVYKEEYL